MKRFLLTPLAASLLLAACAQPMGMTAPLSGRSPATVVSNLSPRKSGPQIYVANRDGGSVLVFPQSAHGNVAPSATIAGSHTTLTQPDSLAVDSTGRIYAATDGGTRVPIFAKGASGNVHPVSVVGGATWDPPKVFCSTHPGIFGCPAIAKTKSPSIKPGRPAT